MIGAVVLAAGGSKRLGQPKQLLTIDGTTLVRRAVEAALGARCSPVVVVLGAAADEVRQALDGVEVTFVENPDWQAGQSTSIRRGVESLSAAAEVRAGVLLVIDQPALSAEVIQRVVEAWDGTESGRVAAAYAGTLGVPALFGRRHFPALAALRGDRGAKALLHAPTRAHSVDWPEGATDIDEPADLPPAE